MSKPRPKVVKEVCSLCGLDWEGHGSNPTAETCVKLLLDEVRSLNAQLAVRPFSRPITYPVPMPYPVYPRPYYPHWYTTCSSAVGSWQSNALNAPAPRAIAAVSSS